MLTPDTLLQGRYRLGRQLGQGGMGTVYEAVDQRLDTVVAVKESHLNDEHLVKQFALEARLLAKLRHPALTKVIDHFEENGAQFLVMEYIPGPDLSALLAEQNSPFSIPQVMKWADQLLNALNYLHTQTPSIIHRDIKPQNLKLTAEDQIILLDFGLAKGAAGGVSKVASVYGYTPTYAPLEQIQGTGTEPRSDLYSLAATLYQLMTNVSPPDALTRVMDITNELPDPLVPANQLNPRIASGVSQTLSYAMHLNRDKRPATAAVMRELLRVAANAVTVPSHDTDKTLVLPAGPSTAETLQMPSGALPLAETASAALPLTEASSGQAPTGPVEPTRNTVRDPALAGFMSGGYEVQERSRLPWIVLPILGVLVLAGLAYGGYQLFGGASDAGQPQAAPVAQASPGATVVGANDAPASTAPASGSNVTQPDAQPGQTPTAGMTPTPKPTPVDTKATPTPIPTPLPPPPTPQATPPPRPTTINGGVMNGKAVSLPKPAYPPAARAAHASGAVNVQVTIDENGSVISATAVSGHPLLRSAAAQAARGARFSPTLLSGQPVKVTGTIIYNFVE
jgi:TonB family protein